jgi:hypothetical protein
MQKKEIIVNGNVVGYEVQPDGELRKPVILPAQQPIGRTRKETYECIGMRSTKRVPHAMDSGRVHYGPYLAIWRSASLVSNPEYKATYPPTSEAWADREFLVTQHEEAAGTFEVLLRTEDEREAKTFFCLPEYQKAYPESDWPQHGGKRDGSGRPATLKDPVTLIFKVSGETATRIKARALAEKRSYADLLREMAEKL